MRENSILFEELKNFGVLFYESHEIPKYIQSNLKDELREYQKESLLYLHNYIQKCTQNINHKLFYKDAYKHLLFHMATGSGKTMIMASTILYLFKEYKYQNFIFFVHTDAIIQKTRENLLNPLSLKYLFNKNIEINGENITFECVENFPTSPNKNVIYLKLTSIHKMHNDLNEIKENSITYEDLKEHKLVLLGDEAHHFNASTKDIKKKNSKEYEEFTWEKTIEKVLHLREDNLLFEFTATINLNDKDIYSKYKNKIIYQYDLKQFMNYGYSKKVILLEANQKDENKILDAVLLSQYKKIIAIQNNILDFKPVVLFKSNTILSSNQNYERFIQIINELTPEILLSHFENKEKQISYLNNSIWVNVIQEYKNSSLISVLENIKEDFQAMNILNVNKTDIIEERPVLLNTLEEINNPIRVIFAVAKLNEGWDVLNLYDIVRIAENSSGTKKDTDSEAQLIGRGARYYPYVYENKKSYKRRFDNSLSQLSILEHLHYHTINEVSYISKLHDSLEQANIQIESDGDGEVVRAKLKDSFKQSEFYKKGKLFFNEAVEIKNKERSWDTYSLKTKFELSYNTAKEEKLEDFSIEEIQDIHIETLNVDKRYYNKAIQKIDFFSFNNLKQYFPLLISINEFISSDFYLGKIQIDLKLAKSITLKDLSSKEKLNFIKEVFEDISYNLQRNYKKFQVKWSCYKNS